MRFEKIILESRIFEKAFAQAVVGGCCIAHLFIGVRIWRGIKSNSAK